MNPKQKKPAKSVQEKVDVPLQKLTVLTYNVWFSDLCFDIRAKVIIDLILHADADVVCLQEVIPYLVRQFISPDKRVREKYKYISDPSGDSCEPYGVLLLSKHPCQIRTVELKSEMGRDFLLGDFTINGSSFGIGTVHLESLGTAPVRQAQLRTISDTLSKGYDHWIVMGDFNFDSEINFGNARPPLENDVMCEILPNAIDTWLFLHKDKSSGKTYDSKINKVIHKYERMRYDRVMLQSTSNAAHPGIWEPIQARLIGTDPVVPNSDIWPSDHFGVCVEFAFNNK